MSVVPIRTGLYLLMVSASLIAIADPQPALHRFVQQQNPAILHLQQLHRSSVVPGTDLVIVMAHPRKIPDEIEGKGWWGSVSSLGIFLQKSAEPENIRQIAFEPGKELFECMASVERVTKSEVTLLCVPEKQDALYRKFIFDPIQGKLIGRKDFLPDAIERVDQQDGKWILLASNRTRKVLLEYSENQSVPFQILSEAVSSEQPSSTDKVQGLSSARFGQRGELSLVSEDDLANFLTIEESGNPVRKYPLPRSVQEMSDERIGPWQVVDDTLWFARSFHAGEGFTGTGGFGYFDNAHREYRIFSPSWIRQRTATALLVEKNDIWVGLAQSGEWGISGSGVIRYDRNTEQIQRLGLEESEVVRTIHRAGSNLLIGTQTGIVLYDGKQLRRFLLEETLDGRLRMVELFPGVVSGVLEE